MGGSCCTERYGVDCNNHMRNILLKFQFKSMSYLEMYKELKMRAVNDYIRVKDFYKICKDLLSSEPETRKLQEGIFKSYFQITKSNEINIYELLLILLPLLNNTDNKNKAFKEIQTYLTKKKKKSKQEVLMFYYSFHTIFITKAVANTLNKYDESKKTEEIKEIINLYKSQLFYSYTEENIKIEVDNLLFYDYAFKGENNFITPDLQKDYLQSSNKMRATYINSGDSQLFTINENFNEKLVIKANDEEENEEGQGKQTGSTMSSEISRKTYRLLS